MKSIEELKPKDVVAFQWNYGVFGKEIIVDTITDVDGDRLLVHFLYGHRSEAEWIKKSDVIAIGDMSASGKIPGWSGRFHILKPDHELLTHEQRPEG